MKLPNPFKLLWLQFRSEWRLRWRDVAVLAVIGIANNALYLGFSYSGMQTVSAGLTALIVSTNPVLTSLLAAIAAFSSVTRFFASSRYSLC